MNNENKIIDKIIADANAKAEEILSQARLEENNKLKQFEFEAKKETNILLEVAKVEAAQARIKEISNADMIAKKRILTTKQKLIEKAIEKVKQKLLTQSAKESENIILEMLKNSNLGSSTEIILAEKSEIELKTAIEKAGYKISKETRDISGGFILKDRDIEYNYSFESIIAIERENLEQLAAQILFN